MTKKSAEGYKIGQIVYYRTKTNVWDRGMVVGVGEKFVFADFDSGYSGAVSPQDLHTHKHTLPRAD